ncbi:MAG: hypothetical protein ACLTER_25755 [Ruminococcus sp.]
MAPGQRVHGFVSIGNGEFSLPATIIGEKHQGKQLLSQLVFMQENMWESRVQ